MKPNRIYLSPPDVGGAEIELVLEAFQSNWIAPAGPNLDAFEQDFALLVGSKHAVAVSSGTAALHLALRLPARGITTCPKAWIVHVTYMVQASKSSSA